MADQQGKFFAGLVVGAVVGGALGTVIGLALAPRLAQGGSKTQNPKDKPLTAGEDPAPLALQDPERAEQQLSQVRRNLEEKIAQLNEAIQDTRAQLLISQSKPGA